MWKRSRVTRCMIAGAALQLVVAMASAAPEGGGTKKKAGPAQVESISGSSVKQISLTEKGAKRIDVQTGEVGTEGSERFVPYRSVMYDVTGGTWVFAVVKPLTFVRQKIVVTTIKGEKAYVSDAPAAGTKIVVTGVAELYGAEKGLGQ